MNSRKSEQSDYRNFICKYNRETIINFEAFRLEFLAAVAISLSHTSGSERSLHNTLSPPHWKIICYLGTDIWRRYNYYLSRSNTWLITSPSKAIWSIINNQRIPKKNFVQTLFYLKNINDINDRSTDVIRSIWHVA